MLEVHRFRIHAGHEAAADGAFPVHEGARHAVVRQHRLGQGEVRQLPVIGADPGIPATAASIHAELAERGELGQPIDAAAEIFVITAVADPVEVGAGLPKSAEVVERVVAEQAAVAVAQVVVRHVGAFHDAGAILVQVAELSPEHEPACAHQPGAEGQVVVGRQVQVDRLAQVEAVAAGIGDRREQQAGAAAFVGRKHEPRQVDHRHLADPQRGATRDRHAFLGIHIDAPRADFPMPGFRRAGRIRGPAQRSDLAGEHYAVGAAVAALFQQLVVDALQGVGVLGLVALGAIGLQAQPGSLVADAAFGGIPLFFLVVDQLLGAHELVAAAQGHVAVEHRVFLGA